MFPQAAGTGQHCGLVMYFPIITTDEKTLGRVFCQGGRCDTATLGFSSVLLEAGKPLQDVNRAHQCLSFYRTHPHIPTPSRQSAAPFPCLSPSTLLHSPSCLCLKLVNINIRCRISTGFYLSQQLKSAPELLRDAHGEAGLEGQSTHTHLSVQ